MPSRVAIVVAPDFGEGLLPLAAELPVWVADTPTNREAVARIREAGDTAGARVTTFAVDPEGTPDAWAAAILGPVVERHGASSQDVAIDALELHGVVVTDALRAALAERGFTDVTGDGEVMTARRPPAT